MSLEEWTRILWNMASFLGQQPCRFVCLGHCRFCAHCQLAWLSVECGATYKLLGLPGQEGSGFHRSLGKWKVATITRTAISVPRESTPQTDPYELLGTEVKVDWWFCMSGSPSLWSQIPCMLPLYKVSPASGSVRGCQFGQRTILL